MQRKFRVACARGVLTFLVAIIGTSVYAQNNSPYSQIIPPSPTSVQFQRYGDYPVSYFNGLADISIPIFTIKEGDITVPITLSYHGSGTRVADVSGFVGLGWTLEAGGMISRVINGVPDGVPDGNPMATFSVPSTTASGVNIGSSWQDFKYMEDGTYDHEYDIYSYNFLGKSGKYIIQNGTPFMFQPKDNLMFTSLTGFNDENGIQYSFGAGGYSGINGSNAVEYQDYQDKYGPKSAISTWQLTNITSSQHPGAGVSFQYQDGPVYQFYQDNTQYILDDFWYYMPNTNGYPPYRNSNDFQYSRASAGVGLVQPSTLVINHTMFLKQINFNSGKIVFNEDGNKMLSSISIYDSNNNLLKTVTLHIIPFKTHNTTLNELSNYELESLSFNDTQSNTVEKYSFNYNSEDIYDAKPIANLSSAGKDYWGFYNGNDGRTEDLSWYPTIYTSDDNPPYSFYTPFTSYDRSPCEYCTKIYTLNKITYPTKGYTTFDYELNRDASNNLYGGLRIKNISNYLADGTLATQKNYTYSTGHAEVTPSKDDFMTNQIGDVVTAGAYSSPRTEGAFRRTTIAPNSGMDYSPQGSSVVYPTVSETNGNYTTTYTYDIGDAYTYETMDHDVNPWLPSYLSGTFPYSGALSWKKISNNYKPWNFGNLLSKGTSGPGFYQGEANEYEDFAAGTARDLILDRWLVLAPSINSSNQADGSNFSNTQFFSLFDDIMANVYGVSVWHYADHYYYSGLRRLKKTTTTYTTDGVNTMSSVKNYHYDNNNYPAVVTRIESTNSKGETTLTAMTYPFDYPTTHPFDDMLTYNLISPVVQQTVTNTTIGTEVSKSVTDYGYFPNDISTPTWPSSGNSGFIGPKVVKTSIKGNTPEPEVTINHVGGMGTPTDLTMRNGITTSYLWGYNNEYPIAQAINSPKNDVFYEGFENGNGTGLYNDAKTGHYSFNSAVTAYQQILTGLDNGSYLLTYWQKVSGVWSQQMIPVTVTGNSYTINILDVQVDDIRFYPAAAQLNTYTYDPLVGMTSAMDAKGKVTYYEYDNFQRLRMIKDNDGNIVKAFCYNYAGQSTDCLVPQLDQPQIIYARIEYSNQTNDGPNYFWDGYYEQEYSSAEDVSIVFYSDPSCTQPLTLQRPLTVSVEEDVSVTSDIYGGPNVTPTINTYSVPAGVGSYSLGHQSIYDGLMTYDATWDEWNGTYTNWNYTVIIGPNNDYTPEPSTLQ